MGTSSTEHCSFPQGVDDPPHVLLWNANEMMPLVIALVVGMMIGQAWTLAGVGLGMVYAYRRVNENKPDGHFVHMGYWAGLYPTKARTMPNPYERQYIA